MSGAPQAPAIAVVPAAGRARRMGRPKLLLPFGDGTVVGATVDALHAGGAERVLLVCDAEDARLAAWCERGRARRTWLERVPHVAPEPGGMLGSVRAGLAAAGPTAGPLLVCPADLPALRPATVAALLAALAESGAPVAVPSYRDRRGHPLAIAPAVAPEVAELDPAVGLRQLHQRHAAQRLELAVDDPGTVYDLDTPADYHRLTGRALEEIDP